MHADLDQKDLRLAAWGRWFKSQDFCSNRRGNTTAVNFRDCCITRHEIGILSFFATRISWFMVHGVCVLPRDLIGITVSFWRSAILWWESSALALHAFWSPQTFLHVASTCSRPEKPDIQYAIYAAWCGPKDSYRLFGQVFIRGTSTAVLGVCWFVAWQCAHAQTC